VTVTGIVVVYCTCPTAVASELAHALVEARLVACVNILPEVQSVYRWDGRICSDAEAMLVMKTTEERLEELTAHIASIHPYDVPEVIAMPITHAHGPYLQWVLGQTTQSE
jgi:periplasmic divalent cation tolerance protein